MTTADRNNVHHKFYTCKILPLTTCLVCMKINLHEGQLGPNPQVALTAVNLRAHTSP